MAKAVDKLAAVTSVPEPLDVNFDHVDLKLWTYNFQGKDEYAWDFNEQMTDIRVLLNITQASTVEIDLDDSDFQVLQDPLFAQWAWNIEDVSFSSQKAFKTTRIQNTANTSYLGDSADLEWVLGQKPIDFRLNDQILFRLCGMQGQQTTLTLTAEDRVASYLRNQEGALAWDRDQHTRAEFVAMLCRQAGVDYFIPEIDVIQPITIDTTASASSVANIVNPNGKGLSQTANLTVLGMPMSKTQKAVANVLLGECDRLNVPLVCWQAILYAGVGETGLGTNSDTYTPNKDGKWGVLQASQSTWPNPHDIAGMADSFLQGGKNFQGGGAIRLANSGVTDMAQIAVTVEVPSIWPNNAYENEWGSAMDAQLQTEINQIVAAYGGPSNTTSGDGTVIGSYAFTRGANETSWDCIQRLASEVAWYAFVRQNRLWYVSGNYLFSQPSQLDVKIGTAGVDYIDPDLDIGARDGIAQCLVYGRTSLWTALPGMVVTVKDRGPCSGKWIVASVENHPRDATQQCIVTLQKPVPKRAEPENTSTSDTGTNVGANSAAQGTPGGAYWAAQQLSAKKLVYTQQNRTLVPLSKITQGETLYDCSASVSWVLLRAGFALPNGVTWNNWAPVSGDFVAGQAGLVAGKGQYMTIWANSDHIFIEFNIPGVGHYQGNTVSPPVNNRGFDLFAWNTPATGGWGGPNPGQGAPTFYPVHYPGT